MLSSQRLQEMFELDRFRKKYLNLSVLKRNRIELNAALHRLSLFLKMENSSYCEKPISRKKLDSLYLYFYITASKNCIEKNASDVASVRKGDF